MLIQLTRDKKAIIDNSDKHLKNFKWQCMADGYARRSFRMNGKMMIVWLHHAIMGYPLFGVVDHIDNNKLNNRRKNLRIISARENTLNQLRKKAGKLTSKFNGASWHKASNSWIAQITIGKRKVHLGCYKNESDAAESYKDILKEVI